MSDEQATTNAPPIEAAKPKDMAAAGPKVNPARSTPEAGRGRFRDPIFNSRPTPKA